MFVHRPLTPFMLMFLCALPQFLEACPEENRSSHWERMLSLAQSRRKKSITITSDLAFWSGLLLSCEDCWKIEKDVSFCETFHKVFIENFVVITTSSSSRVSVRFVEAFLTAYALASQEGPSDSIIKDRVVSEGWEELMIAAEQAGGKERCEYLRNVVDREYGDKMHLFGTILDSE